MRRAPEATFTPTGGLDRVAQARAAVTLASELRHTASTTGTILSTPSTRMVFSIRSLEAQLLADQFDGSQRGPLELRLLAKELAGNTRGMVR
jgi:hypothetical protein